MAGKHTGQRREHLEILALEQARHEHPTHPAVTVHANLRTGIRGIDLEWLGDAVINAPVPGIWLDDDSEHVIAVTYRRGPHTQRPGIWVVRLQIEEE